MLSTLLNLVFGKSLPLTYSNRSDELIHLAKYDVVVKSNLVDKLVIYRAPMIIGGDGIAAWHRLGVEQLGMSKRFAIQNIERIGPDIIETYNRCTEAL